MTYFASSWTLNRAVSVCCSTVVYSEVFSYCDMNTTAVVDRYKCVFVVCRLY